MELSRNTQAVLLLTAYLSKAGQEPATPLKSREWARLAIWLDDRGATPADLLDGHGDALVEATGACGLAPDRLRTLLERGFALAYCAERWQAAGIWFMTRADAAYPDRFKRRLGADAPPVLFGCGHRRLLETPGLAVVGSRNATEQDLTFTSRLGERAAADGYTVVSGGARGVDTTAMAAALGEHGTAVGVLADSLMRTTTSRVFRPHLRAGNLVLISPYNPEAPFNVGNAMARNAQIYALADAAVVVASDEGKGGTWNGAVEALNTGWVPIWVRTHAHAPPGNKALINRGAHPLNEVPEALDSLLETGHAGTSGGTTLLDWSQQHHGVAARSDAPDGSAAEASNGLDPFAPASQSAKRDISRMAKGDDDVRQNGTAAQDPRSDPMSLSFYDLFLERSIALLTKERLNAKEIAEKLDLMPKQVESWIHRAIEDGQIVRKKRPRTYYEPAKKQEKQSGLFE